MAKPGIRTKRPRVLMDDFITKARTDPVLMPLVAVAPVPKKLRKGFRLALRRLCYFVLSRT